MERYGSWEKVCRAAFGLDPDGPYRGHGHLWPAPYRGRGNRPRRHTRADVLDAIRELARERGRKPTVTAYLREKDAVPAPSAAAPRSSGCTTT